MSLSFALQPFHLCARNARRLRVTAATAKASQTSSFLIYSTLESHRHYRTSPRYHVLRSSSSPLFIPAHPTRSLTSSSPSPHSVVSMSKQSAQMSARARRQAAAQTRLSKQLDMKRVLQEQQQQDNAQDLIPSIVMIPSDIRHRCSLPGKLGRVKLYLSHDDMSSLSIFRTAVRQHLVWFFPELEERGLLRVGDDFDMTINGCSLPSASSGSGKEHLVEHVQRYVTQDIPLYLQVTPHNVPKTKPPLSERVTRARGVTEQLARDGEREEMWMVSFYKFVDVEHPTTVAEQLQTVWGWLGIKGRVYVAKEGINAQLAVPARQWNEFVTAMGGDWEERGESLIPSIFHDVYLNVDRVVVTTVGDGCGEGDDETQQPFEKLHVRPREKVLSDGFPTGALDWTKKNGREVSAAEWHALLNKHKEEDEKIILDCRNDYESDVGRFDGAEPLNTQTFRGSWEILEKRLEDVPRDKPILTYCTGGIRCAKVNAFLEQKMGFTNTARLKGGIVSYTKQLRDEGRLEASKFKGVNHVFDGRMGEVVTEDLLDRCVNCGTPCNIQTDCANVKCPRSFDKRIFVQCEECATRLSGACCEGCQRYVLNENAPKVVKVNDTIGLNAQNTTTISTEKTPTTTTASSTAAQRQNWMNNDDVKAYTEAFSMPQPPYLACVCESVRESHAERFHIMSSTPQAQFLKLLVEVSSSQRVLELGTFVGYSTLYMALGLPHGGEIVSVENDDRVADIAQAFFDCRPDDDVLIRLLRGHASEELAKLADEGACFDFAFVDANKKGYIEYVQTLLDRDLIRVGGLIVADNVLFRGEVPGIWRNDMEVDRLRLRNVQNVKSIARYLHRFNEFVRDEKRLEQTVLEVRDGLNICRRIS